MKKGNGGLKLRSRVMEIVSSSYLPSNIVKLIMEQLYVRHPIRYQGHRIPPRSTSHPSDLGFRVIAYFYLIPLDGVPVPLGPKVTFSNLLDGLRSDLGLPTTTSDVLKSWSRRGSRARPYSRFSNSSVNTTETDPAQSRHEVRWTLTLLQREKRTRVEIEDKVLEVIKGMAEAVLHVELDDTWLIEKPNVAHQTPIVDIISRMEHFTTDMSQVNANIPADKDEE